MQTKRASATVVPSEDPGEFDIILSNGALDRDGETLPMDSWVQPLPDRISINANHSADVSHIVGSGRPYFDTSGNLRVAGEFSSTDMAQHLRTLVNEGHLRHVSVEFLRHKNGNGIRNELVGGAFVNVPSNPTARVLSSKALADFDRRLDEILGLVVATKSATANEQDPDDMVNAIHDASVWLGADCSDAPTDAMNRATALRLRLKALQL